MNPSFGKLRVMAKERKIKYYGQKSKEELCKELGITYIPHKPGKIAAPMKTMIIRVGDGMELHFPSLTSLAKAVGRNTVSVSYYEKVKKPMSVVGPGLAVPPGQYIVNKV